jgi:ABC-type glutathione transport system ATPase component
LQGRNLGALRSSDLRRARRDFQMIFQDPYASLNPRMTVFDALAEAIRSHRKVPRVELRPRVVALLGTVGPYAQCAEQVSATSFPVASDSALPSRTPLPSSQS